MFDLLKGIGMLAIVFAHTAELYPLGTNAVSYTHLDVYKRQL